MSGDTLWLTWLIIVAVMVIVGVVTYPGLRLKKWELEYALKDLKRELQQYIREQRR